jgi:phosphatidate cytidylyltransferase
MLRERIITAVVLLALLVPAVLAESPLPFAAVTLVMIAAAGWEWARLCGIGPQASRVAGVTLGVACWAFGPTRGSAVEIPGMVWVGVTAAWVVVGALALRAGPDRFRRVPVALRFVTGWLLIGAAWLALLDAKRSGLTFLASIFVLVWAADIAAYFGGRALGRRKLAPTISPGKSWEGAWSGLAAALVVATAVVLGSGDRVNLFALLQERAGWPGLLAACAALVALSVVGDLCESLAKRAAGAKDSSRLLPGHGGVLDRVDALLPVFPAALALVARH